MLVLILLLTACAETHIDTGPMRPEPPDPPGGQAVRSLQLDDSAFTLYARGDCVTVEVVTPGLMNNVETYCPGQDYPVSATSPCSWLETEPEQAGIGCDAEVPTVLFGRVTSPDIEWVCVATRPENSTTTAVRFLEHGADGYILTERRPDESQYAHLFTFNGARYGQPPLDAPSTDMYAACEAAAPWDDIAISYDAIVTLDLEEPLRRDDVVVSLEAGLGETGVIGNITPDEAGDIFLRIGAHSDGLAIRIQAPESAEALSVLYSWPDALRRIVNSDRECLEIIHIDVAIAATALDGDPESTTLSVRGDPCSQTG